MPETNEDFARRMRVRRGDRPLAPDSAWSKVYRDGMRTLQVSLERAGAGLGDLHDIVDGMLPDEREAIGIVAAGGGYRAKEKLSLRVNGKQVVIPAGSLFSPF